MQHCNILAIVVLLILVVAALYVGTSKQITPLPHSGSLTGDQLIDNRIALATQKLDTIITLVTIFIVMIGIFLAFMVYKKK